MAGLAAARVSGGSEFHAAGPACEKVRSSNLVRSRGVTFRDVFSALSLCFLLFDRTHGHVWSKAGVVWVITA